MLLPFAVLFLVILLLIYYLSRVVEQFTSDEDDVEPSTELPTDSSSISTPMPSQPTTTTTIETNMLSLNSQMNYLRLKYDDLSSRVSKLQQAATMSANMEKDASDLVGDTPIKIDTSK
jgi:hypothetical protein